MIGRDIRECCKEDRWLGIKVHGVLDPSTHSQFVDDNLLFGVVLVQEAQTMKLVLDEYSETLGYIMNKDKF